MFNFSLSENIWLTAGGILCGSIFTWIYNLVPCTFSNGLQMTAPLYRKGRSQKDLEILKDDPHFQNWLTRFLSNIVDSPFGNETISASEIQVDDVDMFGSRFGFGKFKVVTDPFVPSIVFHRSPSVCVLFIIQCGSEKYGLLTVQARIPSGYRYFPELIAGMMDSQTGQCQLIAAKEIEEEAGIKIDVNRLVDLGDAELFKSHDTSAICKSNEDAYDWFRVGDPCKTHQGYFNSPGGSSESTTFYLYHETVSHDQLQSMIKRLEGGEHGLKDEGERIRLIMVPLDNLLDIAPDMKVGHAIALHERYLKRLVDNTPLTLGSLSMSRMRSEMGE